MRAVLPFLIVLLFAAPASAAPPWSDPVERGDGPVRRAVRAALALFSGTVSRPVSYGATRAVVTVVDGTRLFVAFGRTDGTYGAPRSGSPRERGRQRPARGQCERGHRGRVVRGPRGHNDRVYIAFRPAGKPFTPPILQATDRSARSRSPSPRRAGLLLAYDARGVVKTRYKRAAAPLFGRVQALESEPTLTRGCARR